MRRKAIDLMKHHIRRLNTLSLSRQVMQKPDIFADFKLLKNKTIYNNMVHNRYLFRSPYYRKNRNKFDMEDALSYNSKNYNSEEFLYAFRITRESFFLLLDKMKERRAFVRISKKKQQRPVAFQLLVYLFRVGRDGIGGGSHLVGAYFGIAKGSVNNYVRRCVRALLEIKNDVVYWPSKRERKEM